MYLSAKLHLHKDLSALLFRRSMLRTTVRAAKSDRLSPYYAIESRCTNRSSASAEAIWARDLDGNVSRHTYEELLEKANQEYEHSGSEQYLTKGPELAAGNTVCIAPKFSASTFWHDVRDSGAMWFVNTSVHSVFGNGLRPDVWQRFKESFGITQVFEFFNNTEAMLALNNPSMNDCTAHAVGHHGFLQRWMYNRYYVPVAIDAETGEIMRDRKTGLVVRMPYEVGGEILVRQLPQRSFAGYWRDAEVTEKKVARDVLTKGDRYYRSGDALPGITRAGGFSWTGRLGDTFRWKGENVSTAEVSEALGRYPGVLEANVYDVLLPQHDGKAGAAAIHIDPALKEAFDHQDFLRHARTHLPRYAVPLFLRHVQAPYSTQNNKQNRMPLKQEGVHPEKVAAGDKIFWIECYGKGTMYMPFTRRDWEDLHLGKAKL
ncbi:hypothetical protein VTI74DRAFT_2368 [Chaetomium olivicolor]